MIERAGSVVGGRTLSEKTSETGRKVWPLSGRRRRCCCTGGGSGGCGWADGAARASASVMVGLMIFVGARGTIDGRGLDGGAFDFDF